MRLSVLAFGVLPILACVDAARGNPSFEAANAKVQSLYAQSGTMIRTSSSTFTPIPGMRLTLPPKSASVAYALVTFDGPNGLVNGASCSFRIAASATVYGFASVGRTDNGNAAPVILVTRIPLTASTQALDVEWASVPKGMLCDLNTFYSLSAILTD